MNETKLHQITLKWTTAKPTYPKCQICQNTSTPFCFFPGFLIFPRFIELISEMYILTCRTRMQTNPHNQSNIFDQNQPHQHQNTTIMESSMLIYVFPLPFDADTLYLRISVNDSYDHHAVFHFFSTEQNTLLCICLKQSPASHPHTDSLALRRTRT